MRRYLLFTTLFLTSIGCVSEHEVWTTTHQSIMGGEVEQNQTAVVGIAIEQGNRSGTCTGTLVAPNLVLTAQHCIAELESSIVQCGNSPFGNRFAPTSLFVTLLTTMSTNAQDYYQVAQVTVPPGTNDTCGGDIAMLRLTELVPANQATPIVPRIDIPVVPGERYTAYGYGHVGDGSGVGTRRRLENREIICGGEVPCSSNTGVVAKEFAGTEGTCQGDSGGAPIDAQGRVLGALSRGPDGCGGAVYSAVYDWAEWMRAVGENAALAGGYTPDFWVTMGVSEIPANDVDLDGVNNDVDNCPDVDNSNQIDTDNDGMGDACDGDIDGDSVMDEADNCPMVNNPEQYDLDGDTFGDVCDPDDDADGIEDAFDTCPLIANPNQTGPCGNGAGGSISPPTAGNDLVIVFDEGENPDAINMGGHMCSTGTTSGHGSIPFLLFALFFVGRSRRRLPA